MSSKNTPTENIVTKTIKSVADEEGISPFDLSPLYSAIDPEMLTSLPEGAVLSFPYQGYTVTVHGDRTVEVDELVERSHT